MSKKDLEELKDAYQAVFDENDQIKNCGRVACMRLIHIMKKYSTENVGNPDTGTLEINTVQAEYHRIVG
jgi:hypothetical protein